MTSKNPVLLAGKRVKGEKGLHIEVCNLYLSMGHRRTIDGLYRKKIKGNDKFKRVGPVSLKNWSVKYNWTDRVREYDNQAVARATVDMDRLRQKVLAHPYSNSWGQADRLIEVAMMIEKYFEYTATLPDGKEETRINASAIKQWKEIMVFIADRVGITQELLNKKDVMEIYHAWREKGRLDLIDALRQGEAIKDIFIRETTMNIEEEETT